MVDKIEIFPKLLEGKEKDIPGSIEAIGNAIVEAQNLAKSNNVEVPLTISQFFTCQIIEEYINTILKEVAGKKHIPFDEVKDDYIKQLIK